MTIVNVLHLVERIGDHYGGPAKSIPFTSLYGSSECFVHLISGGVYHGDERNSVCDQLNIPYSRHRVIGPKKLGFCPGLFWEAFLFAVSKEQAVLHLHNAWNLVAFFVYFLSLVTHAKVIVSARGAFFPWSLSQGALRKRIAWNVFQRALLRRAMFVHATSVAESKVLGSLGITENVVIIPNGISLPKVDSMLLQVQVQEGFTDKLRLLFVSRIHPKKGIEILLQSLRLIDFPVELTVAGAFDSERYRLKINSLVENLPSDKVVRFVGHLSQEGLKDCFLSADLFVLPSHSENFGIAIAEALSHGLPVVVSEHTPWAEVTEARAGYVVSLDPGSLAKALGEYWSMPFPIRGHMRNNAVDLAKKYEWRNFSSRFINMYLSCYESDD